MKKDLSLSPPRGHVYDSYNPKENKSSGHSVFDVFSPFNISGLKFNKPLKNQWTQRVLLSDSRYLSPNDDHSVTVIKNVTAAFRIMLLYQPLWSDEHVWNYVAQDIQWPTSPDQGDMKKIIICHANARKAYLVDARKSLAKPFKITPPLRICHDAIDQFCHDYFGPTQKSRPSTETIKRKRDQCCHIMKYNPASLVAADFNPEMPDVRSTRSKESDATTGSPKPFLLQHSGTLAGSSIKRKNTDNGARRSTSPEGKKRLASPESQSRLSKAPRLEQHVSATMTGIDFKEPFRIDRQSSTTKVPSNSSAELDTNNSPILPQSQAPSRSGSAMVVSPPLNVQSLPPATRQEFKDRIIAMRMYAQLLRDEIDKIIAIDHRETPDLIVSQIAEMQSICETLKQRDNKIAEILDGQLLK